MSTEISVIETTALTSHRAATNAAGLCRELVVKTAMKIQGRRYVQVEGWQAIANAFGCVASARDVEKVEGGYRATGQVVRVSDGKVLAEAEGFVGDDEKTWASRPVFARRAMAQTRAMSRACRSAFAFVVTLMDAGLETTPAEEMTHVDAEHVESKRPAAPQSLDDDPVAKAKLAVNRATTVADLNRLRSLVQQRRNEGKFTESQHKELVALMIGKAELLPDDDTGVSFEHEAAEHEVQA
jgi:hypothetical protein